MIAGWMLQIREAAIAVATPATASITPATPPSTLQFSSSNYSVNESQGTASVTVTRTGGSDGAAPYSNLVMDANGNLYGTASGGGAHHLGVIFQITP